MMTIIVGKFHLEVFGGSFFEKGLGFVVMSCGM